MGLLDYLSNEQERGKLYRGLLDAVNRGSIGGLLGAPIDIANMALRPVGLGSDKPVMGSEWIGDRMQQAGMVSENRNPMAEIAAGFISPTDLAVTLPLAAKAALPLAAAYGATAIGSKASESAKLDNLANALKSQRGMMATPAGRIPETYVDTNKLADMLERAGLKKGYTVNRSNSSISPSAYVTFSKTDPNTLEALNEMQVRLSNHADKYPELANGIRTSVDPDTGISFEQAVNWLGRNGYPTTLSARYKNIPTWEEVYARADEARNSIQGRLEGLQAAWLNMPKAKRGEMPTEQDILNGMTTMDLLSRK